MIRPLNPIYARGVKPVPVLPTVYTDALSYGEQLGVMGAKVDEVVDFCNNFDRELQGYVDHWLNEHPEATTTVQDGSLTLEKFTEILKKETENYYATPEMFGAYGDNIHDDSEALQSAINTGKPVYIAEKNYFIDQPISIPSYTLIFGEGNGSRLNLGTSGTIEMIGTSIISENPNHKRDLIMQDLRINKAQTDFNLPALRMECANYLFWRNVFISAPKQVLFIESFDNTFDSCSFEWAGSNTDDTIKGIEFVQGESSYGSFENCNCMLFSRCRFESGWRNFLVITGSVDRGRTHGINFLSCHFESVRAIGRCIIMSNGGVNSFIACEFTFNKNIPNNILLAGNSLATNIVNCTLYTTSSYSQLPDQYGGEEPFYITNTGVSEFTITVGSFGYYGTTSYRNILKSYDNTMFEKSYIDVKCSASIYTPTEWSNQHNVDKLFQKKTIGWFACTEGTPVSKTLTFNIAPQTMHLLSFSIFNTESPRRSMYSAIYMIPFKSSNYQFSDVRPSLVKIAESNHSTNSDTYLYTDISIALDYANSDTQTVTITFTAPVTSNSYSIAAKITEII